MSERPTCYREDWRCWSLAPAQFVAVLLAVASSLARAARRGASLCVTQASGSRAIGRCAQRSCAHGGVTCSACASAHVDLRASFAAAGGRAGGERARRGRRLRRGTRRRRRRGFDGELQFPQSGSVNQSGPVQPTYQRRTIGGGNNNQNRQSPFSSRLVSCVSKCAEGRAVWLAAAAAHLSSDCLRQSRLMLADRLS